MTSHAEHTDRIPVAILGATGAVGQTFVRLLRGHPCFKVAEVAASERSIGKRYAEAAHWLEGDLPDDVGALTVVPCTTDAIQSRLVFSALDSSVAGDVEIAFARAGRLVCSNAKNHRLGRDVPLLIPEINAPHLQVIGAQRERCAWTGAIVTNANCASTIAALALAPLHERFVVTALFIATMQAVSGAGYPGVPSLDILGNVIPFIADEEPKIEVEIAKLLGTVADGEIRSAPIRATAHANRVPVENGHTICMSIALETHATPEDVTDAIENWVGHADALSLPSRPTRTLILADAPDRPQPRRDVMAGGGMTVTVGRVRPDALLDIRLVAMGSNTIRGAAGGAIMNAELLKQRGMLDGV
ncbi:MAG: aspartate-semialdehyde dehydrogenase [Gemmatimonadaceae bacterium]